MTTGQICILIIGMPLLITFIYAIIDEKNTKNFTRQIRIQIKKNMRIEKDAKDEIYFKRLLKEVR